MLRHPVLIFPFLTVLLTGCLFSKDKNQARLSFQTKPFKIEKFYASMQGPKQTFYAPLRPKKDVFVTKLSLAVKDAKSKTKLSDEYLCHTHLTIFSDDWSKTENYFLLTLSQGQTVLEFPKGFGIPLKTDDNISVEAQILNFNTPGQLDVIQEFSLETTLEKRTPLTAKVISVRRPVYGEQGHSESCLPPPHHLAAGSVRKIEGTEVTSHWMVEPGQQITETDVTDQLGLKKPVRVHAGIVHLHPFAKDLKLMEKNTKKTVMEFAVKNYSNKRGIQSIRPFKSEKGVLLHPDVSYILRADYHNTTKAEIDAMAAMYLYVSEK